MRKNAKMSVLQARTRLLIVKMAVLTIKDYQEAQNGLLFLRSKIKILGKSTEN